MFSTIKNKIDQELKEYSADFNKKFGLRRLSPLLFNRIKEFISRDGKRVRPVLFCIAYLGFANKKAAGIYRSALSLELLHDFMLVHDDIIDKSETRRGKLSMHAGLNEYFNKNKNLKFSGQDLSLIIGDIIYALALDAFLAIKENPLRKEKALQKLISSTLYTGGGEFIELLLSAKPISQITQNDIYKVYDYKTANYTFASPLTMGAILAGATATEVKKLYRYGMFLGRAFQIQDDIIGTFGKQKDTGKSNITDLLEAKRTLLIWYAFGKATAKNKIIINRIMNSRKTGLPEARLIRNLIQSTGALDYAKNQIKGLFNKAKNEITRLKMRKGYKDTLEEFSRKIIKI
ncbi:MAG: polyprenyl synthetase family protein [Candidatus Omnitrophica bacterium]|jgi:geranylgeranyl diphosphate synthase type I|nr:polyprenyl synthetase family protein [Candidatus Omnitrophota bacterium]